MNGDPIAPNLAQALGELPPMFAPTPLNWWPPAIGWFVLAALVIAAFLAGLIMVRKRITETKILNAALRALSTLRDETLSQHSRADVDPNSQNAILERCSYILRITAAKYFAQPGLSSLSGSAWLKKLDRLSLTKSPILAGHSGCKILSVYEDKLLNDEELLGVIDACSAWIITTKNNHHIIKKAQKLSVQAPSFQTAIDHESKEIERRTH